MARNKYPEETINRILDVSLKLFLEKGYEHTSIQEIINHLGGLTKGAIYHHFKSKEDILVAVINRLYQGHERQLTDFINQNGHLSGLEKLRRLILFSLEQPHQAEVFNTAPNMLKSPQMLAMQMQNIYMEAAPFYVKPIIEEGIADGSIKTQYPDELAEVILLLINIWLNPMIHYIGLESIKRRVSLCEDMLRGIGIDLFDDEMKHNFYKLCGLFDQYK